MSEKICICGHNEKEHAHICCNYCPNCGKFDLDPANPINKNLAAMEDYDRQREQLLRINRTFPKVHGD